MEFNGIKHIVFTPDVKEADFIKSAKQSGVNCIPILDVRSAVYTATGISAQNKEMTVVCVGDVYKRQDQYRDKIRRKLKIKSNS